MAVQLNHTVVATRDKQASAEFVARILGLGPLGVFSRFVTLGLANGVTLLFGDAAVIQSEHYAFLVDDAEFDAIFARIVSEGIEFFADGSHNKPGEINTREHGRGLYFNDLDGHNLEVLTRTLVSG